MSSWPGLAAISSGVESGEFTAREMVEKSLEAVIKANDYDALISVFRDEALARADEIDTSVKKGDKVGRLAGVPFIAKDNFLMTAGKTTAASNILRPFEAPYQSTAIERLEAEGAICVAKANLDAFAHGSSTENSDWFVTKNPHDMTRVPGGSSGGSAASVALGIAPFALGTDTGGSIRLPASFSGTVGVKPTYGLVSRSGVIAMASSTDVVGPLAMNVDDAALVLDVMAGKDELDSTTIDKDSYADLDIKIEGQRIGVVKEYMEGLEPGVQKVISGSIDKLKQAGAQVEEVSLPSLPLALAVYYIVCPAEVSSNLSRYDGQRYGYSAEDAKNLDESYELSRDEGFGAEAKRRIMIGTYVLSSGYYDAYYKKAQTVRTKIINEFTDAFTKFDFLIGPTCPDTAFKIGERSSDPLKMYLTDIMTVAANMSGNPAISLPAGTADGLPVGLQIIAPMRGDRQMLGLAKAFEGLK
jgi:aspartyl-tRNA(Asn)/glutamyl-tRNA(Gln) amidotransferase subunit A